MPFEAELAALKKTGLYRDLKTVEKISGSKIVIAGKEYINFSSNDYLGLSHHPQVIQKANEAAREFGVGAGASRLISGNTVLHEQLERKIARFKGRAAALVFATGYQANLGAITALVNEKDTIIIDRLNHASIIDACRLSKAKLQVYKHRDMRSLAAILKSSAKYKKRLIVTDSVFSMDGDLAPLPDIIQLARRYHALTMIDEAHATGVLGKRGKGAEEHFGVEGQIDIVMGTLSKAVGSLGGFITGEKSLIDYLKNKARSFIYTTALPPAVCAAALAALEIIEQQPELIRNLRMNSRFLREKLFSGSEATPILPVLIGDAEKTMELSRQLMERGLFVQGIRPPSVPKGESRLRITVTALHNQRELGVLADAFAALY